MQGADPIYYKRRAAEEQRAAERSADERARRSHLELAARYAELAADPARMPGRSDGRTHAVLPPNLTII